MNSRQGRLFIVLLFGLGFAYVASGFFVPLMIGAAIALLLYPIYDFLVYRKRWPAAPVSILLTFGVTVLLILPTTLLSIRGVRYAAERFQAWKDSPFSSAPGADTSIVQSVSQIPVVATLIEQVAQILRMDQADVIESTGTMLKNIGLRAADFLTMVISSLPSVVVGILLLIIAIYVFLSDGSRVVRFFRVNSFFPDEQTEEIFKRFGELCRAVLLASLVSGLVQAVIYVLAGAIAGVGDLVLIGFSVFLASFLPVVGASPVTFGVATFYLLTGQTFPGYTLLIAAFIASVADNFVRPFVLKGGANLHPLVAIVSVLGGIQIFGFAGVFLGPILAGMFFVFLSAHVQTRDLE